jgi:regulator of protease activity HflC (stomatin/prohibitin superfamily)
MREQVFDIPSQSCISRDNIQIEVDGIVYLKVMNPQKASYGIENYRRASINLAQTTMRSEVGKLTLGQTFSEREELNVTIVREIDTASDPWGIKVLRYEVKNITPSEQVVHTLEKQMEAERQKRAEITLAKAEKESRINLSEGKRQEAINLSEGEKQKRINEAKGRAQEITILADATAKGIEMIAQSIKNPGGPTAVKMQLLERFIEELEKILKHANLSVIPNEMANIVGFFEGMSEVTGNLKKN